MRCMCVQMYLEDPNINKAFNKHFPGMFTIFSGLNQLWIEWAYAKYLSNISLSSSILWKAAAPEYSVKSWEHNGMWYMHGGRKSAEISPHLLQNSKNLHWLDFCWFSFLTHLSLFLRIARPQEHLQRGEEEWVGRDLLHEFCSRITGSNYLLGEKPTEDCCYGVCTTGKQTGILEYKILADTLHIFLGVWKESKVNSLILPLANGTQLY